MPRSHKRRAVLRPVTRQFRHLTLRVLAGFSRLTSMQCLCLQPRRPQRASRASERASAPTRSPLVHSSSAFHRLSSSPRRPTFPTHRQRPVLRGLTASTSFSFLLHDQAACRRLSLTLSRRNRYCLRQRASARRRNCSFSHVLFEIIETSEFESFASSDIKYKQLCNFGVFTRGNSLRWKFIFTLRETDSHDSTYYSCYSKDSGE